MTIASISEFRRADGCFAKGVSGNPGGRPKGSRNRATIVAEAMVQERAEPLTAKMIELAEAGDAGLLQLFFKAIIPPARDAAIELDVPVGRELDVDEVFRLTARALFDGEDHAGPGAARRTLPLARLAREGAEIEGGVSGGKAAAPGAEAGCLTCKAPVFFARRGALGTGAAEDGGCGLSRARSSTCIRPVFLVAAIRRGAENAGRPAPPRA